MLNDYDVTFENEIRMTKNMFFRFYFLFIQVSNQQLSYICPYP